MHFSQLQPDWHHVAGEDWLTVFQSVWRNWPDFRRDNTIKNENKNDKYKIDMWSVNLFCLTCPVLWWKRTRHTLGPWSTWMLYREVWHRKSFMVTPPSTRMTPPTRPVIECRIRICQWNSCTIDILVCFPLIWNSLSWTGMKACIGTNCKIQVWWIEMFTNMYKY